MWNECNCTVVWTFFGIVLLWDWNVNWPFQSCGHCWVFQICCHIEWSTLTESSFRIWNNLAGFQLPPLALFIVMLPSRLPRWFSHKESTWNAGDMGSIPGSGRCPGGGPSNPLQYSCLENPVDRGAWQSMGSQRSGHNWSDWAHTASIGKPDFTLQGVWLQVSDHTTMVIQVIKTFLYLSSSVYSCHLFLISSASVRFIPFLSFIRPILAWNVPLLSLILLRRSLAFSILLFYSISCISQGLESC